MFTDPTPRPAEHLHSRACLGSAIISAVQNLRDLERFTDHEFRLEAQTGYFLDTADDYLATGLQTCTCPPCHNPGCCTDRENGS